MKRLVLLCLLALPITTIGQVPPDAQRLRGFNPAFNEYGITPNPFMPATAFMPDATVTIALTVNSRIDLLRSVTASVDPDAVPSPEGGLKVEGRLFDSTHKKIGYQQQTFLDANIPTDHVYPDGIPDKGRRFTYVFRGVSVPDRVNAGNTTLLQSGQTLELTFYKWAKFSVLGGSRNGVNPTTTVEEIVGQVSYLVTCHDATPQHPEIVKHCALQEQ